MRTFAASACVTCVSFLIRRMRFAGLVARMWRLPECIRKIFPFFVTLKRFAAPRCVLTLSFFATIPSRDNSLRYLRF